MYDSPIRILHVIGIMNRGGAETMIMNLYRNIDRTKVQFDFVENEGEEAAFDKEILSLGGRIYRCPRYQGKNHFAYTTWWHAFWRNHNGEYPIVHGHIGSTATIYLAIAKKYGSITIAHSHNTNALKTTSDIIYSIFSYPTRYIADYFFACSRKAGISRYGKKIGKDSAKCRILPNAIDTERFVYHDNRRQKMRQLLEIKDEQFVIGNVGRFAQQKNHRFLIEIFDMIHQENPYALLLLLGDGELRPEIEKMIKERCLQNHVVLAGIQVNTWDYYQVMDVFLMPSLNEGLPVSLVEAQAAGLPCYVSTGVPQESAITNLVQFKSLEDSAEGWATEVLKCFKKPRRIMTEEIRRAGYDIAETSRWLQNYYMEVRRAHGQ